MDRYWGSHVTGLCVRHCRPPRGPTTTLKVPLSTSRTCCAQPFVHGVQPTERSHTWSPPVLQKSGDLGKTPTNGNPFWRSLARYKSCEQWAHSSRTSGPCTDVSMRWSCGGALVIHLARSSSNWRALSVQNCSRSVLNLSRSSGLRAADSLTASCNFRSSLAS